MFKFDILDTVRARVIGTRRSIPTVGFGSPRN
jgi:hypothetical protein